ncbi:hypothetical protein EMCRGX_G034356 [Ephydatia muelleri]
MPHGRAAVLPRKRFAPLKDALLFFAALSLVVERVGGAPRMQVAVASPHANYGRVTLRCFCDSAVCIGGKVVWQRRVNDSSQELRGRQQPADAPEITFVLTPQLEGMYSCIFNSSRSNEVELIANLVPDPAVNKASYYQVYAGSNITLPCAFTPGAMATSYHLDWQKELTPIYGSQAISLPRSYTVSQNFSLIINNAELSDGALYQCSVTVSTSSSIVPITTYAPAFKLDVVAPLRMIQAPTTVTFTRAKIAAVFSCKVSGSPKPRLIWSHKGAEVHGDKYTLTESTDTSSQTHIVTSTLTISAVEASDSGPVMCMAVVTETQQGLTGSADLIALSCVSDVQLQVLQDGGVQIKVALATVIPGPFGLVLSYTPPSQSFGSYVTQVSDLSFADVQEVTFKIPQQKLPTMFNSFSVKVALLTRGVQGDSSNDSNVVILASGTPSTAAAVSGSDCSCDNTPLIVAAALFVVELLVIVGALVVAGVVVAWCRHRNMETSIELEYRDSTLDDHHKHALGNAKASCTTLDSGELAKMEDQAVRPSRCRTLPSKGRRARDEGTGERNAPHSRSVEDVSLQQPHPPAEGFVYSTLRRGTGGGWEVSMQRRRCLAYVLVFPAPICLQHRIQNESAGCDQPHAVPDH